MLFALGAIKTIFYYFGKATGTDNFFLRGKGNRLLVKPKKCNYQGELKIRSEIIKKKIFTKASNTRNIFIRFSLFQLCIYARCLIKKILLNT